MVNSENFVLFKDLAHALVDELVGLEVVAQRLFQNDASFGGVELATANCSHTVLNKLGAVARYITT